MVNSQKLYLNNAPFLQSKLPKKYKLQLTKEIIVPLPNVIDNEENPVAISFIGLPSFITFDSFLSQILIRPSNAATDLGIFKVKG
jgi:hypothetical protein